MLLLYNEMVAYKCHFKSRSYEIFNTYFILLFEVMHTSDYKIIIALTNMAFNVAID